MTTQQIAERLVELCRKGDFETAQRELYAQDAVSIEQHASPFFDKETKGLEAIIEKGKKFTGMVEETHSMELTDPIVSANSFATLSTFDMTMKQGGRSKMQELCIYDVKDGKVVTESFHN